MTKHKTTRGNILFLILLAVVLFAALSYAVTSSMRGGGRDASSEAVSAKASEILNYFAELSTVTQRMMLINNVKDYELNFYSQNPYAGVVGNYDNVNCATDTCRVFSPNGGGASNKKLMNYQREGGAGPPGVGRIFLMSVPGAGTDLPDIIFTYYAVKMELCKEINRRMGHADLLFNAPVNESASTFLYYNSPYPTGPFPNSTLTLNVPQSAGIAGTFCACGGVSEAGCGASFYPAIHHVLLAR